MTEKLVLISHHLCPYVQRAAIALTEKGVPFERITIDLADKPDWFKALSPLGKVPVLRVGDRVIFESAVILEYLEETEANPLHPADPLERAEHRGWIEFGSQILNAIAGFYSARDKQGFEARRGDLAGKFARLEERLGEGSWFGGENFGLVDATFGPIFRYFDTFDAIADFGILAGLPKLAAWRQRLADRASVKEAVADDYPGRLQTFLRHRGSVLSATIETDKARPAA